MTGGSAPILEFGLGLTLAVLVDATLVRLLLVPAALALLGERAWWAPAPLARLHRRFGLSEAPAAGPADPGTQAEPTQTPSSLHRCRRPREARADTGSTGDSGGVSGERSGGPMPRPGPSLRGGPPRRSNARRPGRSHGPSRTSSRPHPEPVRRGEPQRDIGDPFEIPGEARRPSLGLAYDEREPRHHGHRRRAAPVVGLSRVERQPQLGGSRHLHRRPGAAPGPPCPRRPPSIRGAGRGTRTRCGRTRASGGRHDPDRGQHRHGGTEPRNGLDVGRWSSGTSDRGRRVRRPERARARAGGRGRPASDGGADEVPAKGCAGHGGRVVADNPVTGMTGGPSGPIP